MPAGETLKSFEGTDNDRGHAGHFRRADDRRHGQLIAVAISMMTLVACRSAADPRSGVQAEQRRSALGVSPGAWQDLGPRPKKGGSRTLPILGTDGNGQPIFSEDVTGALTAVVAHPTDPNTAYVAAAGGGIWRMSVNMDGSVHWTALTDFKPSLVMSAVAIDPADPATLVAGTGANGLIGLGGTDLVGLVYVTHDGGNVWTTLEDSLLLKRDISSVAIRGSNIFVASPEGGLFRSAQGGSFTRMNIPGPDQGVLNVVSDPTSALRFYAAVKGNGIYLTEDAGNTWTKIPTAAGPANADLLNAAANDQVNNLKMSVANDGRLFVRIAASGDVSWMGYTDTHGASFTAIEIPKFSPDSPGDPGNATPGDILSITTAPASDSRPQSFIIRTTVPHGMCSNMRVRISGVVGEAELTGQKDFIAEFDDRLCPKSPPNPPCDRFRLLDPLTSRPIIRSRADDSSSGGKWQKWISVHRCGGVEKNGFTVDPTNSNLVYVAGNVGFPALGNNAFTIVLRGDARLPADNAIPSKQWASLVGSTGTNLGTTPHADGLGLAVDAAGGLLETCDGGAYRYDQPRTRGDWTTLNTDIGALQFHDVAVDTFSNEAFGGAQDNGTSAQRQTGFIWDELDGGDGGDVQADVRAGLDHSDRYFESQPNNGNFGFAVQSFAADGSPTGSARFPELCTHRSGNTCDVPLANVDGGQFIERFALNKARAAAEADPNAPIHIVFEGVDSLFESTNAGTDVHSLMGGALVQNVAYGHPSVAGRDALWAVARGNDGFPSGIFRRLDGTSPLELVQLPGVTPTGNLVGDVVMAPQGPERAYVVAQDHAFFTADGGATWTDITGDLTPADCGSPPRSRAFNLHAIRYASSSRGDRLFVGADTGVFVAAVDNPGVWTTAGSNLPHAVATDLDYNPTTDTLVVGTFGRGTWRLANAAALNRAPTVSVANRSPGVPCQSTLQVAADASCHASLTPGQLGGGSADPDGDPVTLTDTHPGAFALGQTCTTLTVSDTQGASATCDVNVVVVDNTPPRLTPPANRTVSTCTVPATIQVGQATATDNCAPGAVPTGRVISTNGVTLAPPIPVIGGQVTVGIGTHVIEWSVSDGPNTVTARQTVVVGDVIQARQSFLIDDRGQVQNSGGGFAAILNSGSGPTRLGQDGRSGGIVSVGAVTVQHRAIVNGNVVSGGTVAKDNDATITGTTTANASVLLPALPTLPAFPTPSAGGFTVNAGRTESHPPASYSAVSVVNGGTLILSAGDYFFQSFTINASSTVRATPTTRIFVRDNLVFNAPVRATSGTAVQSVFLGFAGATLNLFAPFNGTLVAPNAAVTFGTGSGLTYTGSFFGRILEVTPASVLVCRVGG